jgi:DNA-binding ferritin-like protein
LSDIIDVMTDVKQAAQNVPRARELHEELDQLLQDLKTWATLLVDREGELGSSPIGSVVTVAGRKLANLWPGNPTEDEVRRTILEYLERLSGHLVAARGQQGDEGTAALLKGIQQQLERHIRTLSKA